MDPTGRALEGFLRQAPGERKTPHGGQPRGRIYALIGSAGQPTGSRGWLLDPSWLAARSEEFGYMDIVVHNASVATGRYVSSPSGAVLDEFSFGPTGRDYE